MVDLHKAGKGYKSISKSLDVHQSTVRQIVYKSSALLLLSLGVAVLQRWLQEHSAECSMRLIKKNPRVSAKDLQNLWVYDT